MATSTATAMGVFGTIKFERCNNAIIVGGPSKGKIGKNIERVVTVLNTANLPADILRPRTFPSSSETLMPFIISSMRVKETLQVPAVMTAKYGTKGPNFRR